MSFATKILKFSPLGRISLFSYTKNERYINHFFVLVTLVVIFCRHEKEAFYLLMELNTTYSAG